MYISEDLRIALDFIVPPSLGIGNCSEFFFNLAGLMKSMCQPDKEEVITEQLPASPIYRTEKLQLQKELPSFAGTRLLFRYLSVKSIAARADSEQPRPRLYVGTRF